MAMIRPSLPLVRVVAEYERLQDDYEVAKSLYGNSGNGGADFDQRWTHRLERAAANVAAVRSEWKVEP